MQGRYGHTILNYYDKFFQSVFHLEKKPIIQYVNLRLPSKLADQSENTGLDWFVNITHQTASVKTDYPDWFIRQFLYAYCSTTVMNFSNIVKAPAISFSEYEQLKMPELMLEYRRADRLLYQLQDKVQGKDKDVYIMAKDVDINTIKDIEYLKTPFTNKFLCIRQALVNGTFEQISEETEEFMKENKVKLLPLKSVSSFAITEKLLGSKKYKNIFFEDDAILGKFSDASYPKRYLPDVLLLAVEEEELDNLTETRNVRFSNFANMVKEHYTIQNDMHEEDLGMKYFTLLKRSGTRREAFESLTEETDFEEFQVNKRINEAENIMAKQRQKTRRAPSKDD